MPDPMLDGLLEAVDTEEHVAPQPKPAKTEKVETKVETPSESNTETKTKTETKTEVEPSEDDDEVIPDEQDFSRQSDETKSDKEETTTEPSKTETDKPVEAEPVEDWKPSLPVPPQFNLAEPETDENGYITNMTPQEYQTYVVERAKHEMRVEGYNQTFENQALDAAEKILPELKSSPAIRTMVENARVASILTGQQINSFEAAKIVKEALGLTSTKIAEAKAAGAQNTKASITIQKNAAVETTGTTKVKPSNPKNDNLTKRLKQGEDSAFAELFDDWDKSGKLS